LEGLMIFWFSDDKKDSKIIFNIVTTILIKMKKRNSKENLTGESAIGVSAVWRTLKGRNERVLQFSEITGVPVWSSFWIA